MIPKNKTPKAAIELHGEGLRLWATIEKETKKYVTFKVYEQTIKYKKDQIKLSVGRDEVKKALKRMKETK